MGILTCQHQKKRLEIKHALARDLQLRVQLRSFTTFPNITLLV